MHSAHYIQVQQIISDALNPATGVAFAAVITDRACIYVLSTFSFSGPPTNTNTNKIVF